MDKNLVGTVWRGLRAAIHHRYSARKAIATFPASVRAERFSDQLVSRQESTRMVSIQNRLRQYFDGNVSGPGIYKFLHYFDIYQRHLSKFVDQQPHVLEVGVFSGGSLGMWQDYFGEGCTITGVDIQPECLAYERKGIRVLVGNQGDADFWTRVRQNIPPVDIVIDDGSHLPQHQIATLEGILPHLLPGGVYICEDIAEAANEFAAYVHTLADHLNAAQSVQPTDEGMKYIKSPLQELVRCISIYPFCVVIETHEAREPHLMSVRRGTEWQPQSFLVPKTSASETKAVQPPMSQPRSRRPARRT